MSKKIGKKKHKPIMEYLRELRGCSDYNQRIEDLMDEFGLDEETAEMYVWNEAAGFWR